MFLLLFIWLCIQNWPQDGVCMWVRHTELRVIHEPAEGIYGQSVPGGSQEILMQSSTQLVATSCFQCPPRILPVDFPASSYLLFPVKQLLIQYSGWHKRAMGLSDKKLLFFCLCIFRWWNRIRRYCTTLEGSSGSWQKHSLTTRTMGDKL